MNAKSCRNYGRVPCFSSIEMQDDFELQSYSNSIESTLCAWDNSFQNRLKDESALRVLEMLLDKHFFHDENVSAADDVLQKGFEMVSTSIFEDLPDIAEETLNKTISVVHFVAKRRTTGGREYFDFIHQFVGFRVAPGVRVFPGLSRNPESKYSLNPVLQ
ncbi:MAG TPA: hypothetical protein DET40_10485 [Lentisphaeria bacterium]|nr:MAG: hypothetical protein A2X45_09790 [Lentisphaerae bacterium GWF2_50_93]HCE43964.1 hypothetical protein [Lentisphaeria bacterium]